MIDQKLKLVDVIQVMLHRRSLPLQLRATPMWLYKPEDAAPIRHIFRTDLDGIWMTLFKPSMNTFPAMEEDCGLDAANPPKEVHSNLFILFNLSIFLPSDQTHSLILRAGSTRHRK